MKCFEYIENVSNDPKTILPFFFSLLFQHGAKFLLLASQNLNKLENPFAMQLCSEQECQEIQFSMPRWCLSWRSAVKMWSIMNLFKFPAGVAEGGSLIRFGAKISMLPSSESMPVNKTLDHHPSLSLPSEANPSFWRYWTRRLSSYNTPAHRGLGFFPWGMLTDWRGLHLAVCIFFHIFHHRFKWNHIGSEREEGRQHRAAEETHPGSGDARGVWWASLWNVFFTEVPQPRSCKTITYNLQTGVESL